MSHEQAREHLLAGLTRTDWAGRPPELAAGAAAGWRTGDPLA